MNGGISTAVGSITTPINNTVSVWLSRIARKKGLFTIKGIGGGPDSSAAAGADCSVEKNETPCGGFRALFIDFNDCLMRQIADKHRHR